MIDKKTDFCGHFIFNKVSKGLQRSKDTKLRDVMEDVHVCMQQNNLWKNDPMASLTSPYLYSEPIQIVRKS